MNTVVRQTSSVVGSPVQWSDVATKILEHLGLRAEALPTLRAQAPPVTLELFPAA